MGRRVAVDRERPGRVTHAARPRRAQGAEFFTALFGSERFEHLVGELMIAAAARVGGDLGATQLRKLQARAHAGPVPCPALT